MSLFQDIFINISDPVNQEGMILSDEPGYYEDGNFGIRIETLVRVVPAETKFSEKSRTPFLTFTPVTVVPIQVFVGSNTAHFGRM